MTRILLWMLIIPAQLCAAAAVAAESPKKTATYAIVIGNNDQPANQPQLPLLQYADDDAVRFYQFFRRFTPHVYLLTEADQATKERYGRYPRKKALPGEIDFAQIRRSEWSVLKKIGVEIAGKIAADKRQGRETAVYFVYSGHGAKNDQGTTFLTLSDQELTRRRLHQLLQQLDADYYHLLLDACFAAGVVGERGSSTAEMVEPRPGRFAEAHEPALAQISREQTGQLAPAALPGLGYISSSTDQQEAHEWSRIESGVFTHVVLSGLSGAADTNRDGLVEYSELAAFFEAANQEVLDPKGRLQVVAHPPPKDPHTPLVNLSQLQDVFFLAGDPKRLGHFYIELENGQRYMEANLGRSNYAHIAVPLHYNAFLRGPAGDAELAGNSAPYTLSFTEIRLNADTEVNHKGSVASSLQTGLFASPFAADFYRAYIQNHDQLKMARTGETLSLPPQLHHLHSVQPSSVRKPLAITSLLFAGGALVTAGVFGGLAIEAKRDFESTTLQLPSKHESDRYKRFGTIAWISGGAAIGFGLLSWWLWPKSEKRSAGVQLRPSIRTENRWQVGLDVQLPFSLFTPIQRKNSEF